MKINSKLIKLIETHPVALATTMKNGNPNVIGVAFAKVIDKQLLITDNFMKQTLEDIKNNPNVVIVVWDKNMEGYKLLGQASYYKSGKWVRKVKNIPENQDMPAKGAILIEITRIIKSA